MSVEDKIINNLVILDCPFRGNSLEFLWQNKKLGGDPTGYVDDNHTNETDVKNSYNSPSIEGLGLGVHTDLSRGVLLRS